MNKRRCQRKPAFLPYSVWGRFENGDSEYIGQAIDRSAMRTIVAKHMAEYPYIDYEFHGDRGEEVNVAAVHGNLMPYLKEA